MTYNVCWWDVKPYSTNQLLNAACGNFTKFATLVQLRIKRDLLDCETKNSKVNVAARLNARLRWRHTD